MKKDIKSIVGFIMGSGPFFNLFKYSNRKKLLILYYHRIIPKEEFPEAKEINMFTSADTFGAQMEFISKFYNPVREQEVADGVSAGKFPDYSTWVTFDDGYKDNYAYAYPILKKYNIPATFFVTTGYINKTVKPSADCGEADFMSWEELKEVSENNISIGAHTVSHRILSGLPGEELEKEIAGSKSEIERRLGKKIISFAYPHGKKGDCNLQKSAPILEKNGFKLAVTTVGGFNSIKSDTSRFCLRRMGISYDDTLNVFKFKIGFGGFWQK